MLPLSKSIRRMRPLLFLGSCCTLKDKRNPSRLLTGNQMCAFQPIGVSHSKILCAPPRCAPPAALHPSSPLAALRQCTQPTEHHPLASGRLNCFPHPPLTSTSLLETGMGGSSRRQAMASLHTTPQAQS